MRTTLTIDDATLDSVMHYSGKANPAQAIREALQAYLQQQRKRELLALRGQIPIEANWQELRQRDVAP
jgi:metal-responsive CopG/Arc/MetJ family transcriptional regulator